MSAMMTLCWSCRRALGTMGCPWCEYDEMEHRVRFDPVPGWTAKKQVRVHGMTSYTVIQCPLYLGDEERSVEGYA